MRQTIQFVMSVFLLNLLSVASPYRCDLRVLGAQGLAERNMYSLHVSTYFRVLSRFW